MHIKNPAADAAALATFLAKGGAVKRVNPATVEVVKASVSAYWGDVRHFNATGESPKARAERESFASEQRGEQMAEHFAGCAAAGVSSEVAMADWNYMNQSRKAQKRQIQAQVRREMDEERGY